MNYVKLLYFTICFPCFVFGQSSAKQVSFRAITVEHGLSQNSVVSIAQDSIGYMWFATQDGLNRYDGKQFKIFDRQFEDVTRPSFSKLGKLFVDRNNTLWIISNSGILEKYEVETEAFQTIRTFDSVSTIFQDSNNNMYVGTYGNGLYISRESTKDTLQLLKPKDLTETVYDFLEDDNSIYFSTSNRIFNIRDDAYTEVRIIKDGPVNPNALTKTIDKTIWLGSFGQGLFHKPFNKNEFVRFDGFPNIQLPGNLIIQDVLADSNNQLWIATYGQGVFLINFQKESIQHFEADKNNPYALHYNDVLSIYEDFTGIIWLGTDGAGLSYYDEHLLKFNVLTNNQTPKDISVDVVRSIAKDDQNTIWLGTSGKGLTRINSEGNLIKTYTAANSDLNGDRIMSLLFVDNDLWIGHQANGLNSLSANGKFNDYEQLKNFTIWKIYKDASYNIWLCTRDNGLILFDKTKGIIKQFSSDNSILTSNNIRTIEEGRDGELWIGAEETGLFKFDQKTNAIESVNSVPDKIKSLYFENDHLWIGTNGNGLKVLNTIDNSLLSYTKDDGLPNNVIYGILPGDNNALWLSSNKGITQFSYADIDNPVITNYGNYDGLQAFEFNTGAYYKDNNGMLYFGGLEGINWFKPNQLTFNQSKPKTIISGVDLFNEPQSMQQGRSFKHNENTITFTFSSLHYSQPERNLYKYQLVNHDQHWIQSGNVNTAHYTNLTDNAYVFRVVSSNYDGVWNEEAADYSFTILKPWYLTNVSKIAYLILFLLTIYSIYNYLKWRWHMRMQLDIEQAETERLKKLDEFKSKLYTNISHEFRTPLTLISGPIDKYLSKPDLNEEDKEDFTLIQRSSKRLLNLVNQMLDLSKLESGSLKLAVTKGNLEILLRQIAASFEYQATKKNIDFVHEIATLEEAYFDKDVIEKIVINLLSNAIKYAPRHGKVHFSSAVQDGQIIITVINNGNSIKSEDLPKLFQRFYRTHKKSDGVGIGLSLVKELTILSHGNIVAHTMNEDDIQFTVTLPIEPSYFNQSELVYQKQHLIESLDDDNDALEHEDIAMGSEKLKPLLLIVEDDADIRQFIGSNFKKDYTIEEASDGKQGLSMAIKRIPDIVISDIMMPEIDGIELCNTLKQDQRTSHIPIILLTAKVGEENEIQGLKTGADAYITKPFNIEKLRIRVEKLIQLRLQLQKQYGQNFELQSKEIDVSSAEQQFLKRLQEVLDAHITESDFNSEAFSKEMLMSRMQLHRKLKALTNLTTSEFLRSQRLKLAIELLRKSDCTVAEVAYQVGFNTPSYFIKSFKETYHCTPNDFVSNL